MASHLHHPMPINRKATMIWTMVIVVMINHHLSFGSISTTYRILSTQSKITNLLQPPRLLFIFLTCTTPSSSPYLCVIHNLGKVMNFTSSIPISHCITISLHPMQTSTSFIFILLHFISFI